MSNSPFSIKCDDGDFTIPSYLSEDKISIESIGELIDTANIAHIPNNMYIYKYKYSTDDNTINHDEIAYISFNMEFNNNFKIISYNEEELNIVYLTSKNSGKLPYTLLTIYILKDNKFYDCKIEFLNSYLREKSYFGENKPKIFICGQYEKGVFFGIFYPFRIDTLLRIKENKMKPKYTNALELYESYDKNHVSE